MGVLHHIALGVARVEEIAAFYRQIFDLEEHARHHYEDGRLRSIWLDLGGPILMVEYSQSLAAQSGRNTALAAVEPDTAVGEGLFLTAFSVADADERRAVERRAEAAGQSIETRSEFSSYFRDPEGNRVAVSHYAV